MARQIYCRCRLTGFKIGPTVYPPIFTNHRLSHVPLPFFLLANKLQTSYIDVCRLQYKRRQNLVWKLCATIAYAEFETAIPSCDNSAGLAVKVKACHFDLGQLAAKNTVFGTQQAVWKERLWEKVSPRRIYYGLTLLPPAAVSDCFPVSVYTVWFLQY